MGVAYPLFAFEKDDKSMRLIEDSSRILYHCEAIDIENGEYVFWDANGEGVSVTAFKSELSGVTSCAPAFPLRDALTLYAKGIGLSEFVLARSPIEVWSQIQAELDTRPRKSSFLSRMFSK